MTPEERDEIAEHYGFAEGEREAIARELAERAQRIKSDEMLAWAKQRNEQRERERNEARRERESERAAADQPPKRDWPKRDTSQMSNTQQEWMNWTRREIRAARKADREAMLGGIADVMREEREANRKAMAELRTENETLRADVVTLQSQIAELRGEIRGRTAAEGDRQTPSHLRAV